MARKSVETTQKWGKNETETKPKRHQTDTKTVPSDPKSTQNGPKAPIWSQNDPYVARNWPQMARRKPLKSHLYLHENAEQNTQNSLRILPDTHCTAHFHRLKRRF